VTEGSVCVHGLGYVGLPTAAVLAGQGYDVYGYDIDESRRAALRRGEVGFAEERLTELARDVVADDRLTVVDACRPASYHIVCVPTPLTDDCTVDLSAVDAAVSTAGAVLRPGDTVVVESTIPPGTTVDRLVPRLEAESSLSTGAFDVVYSPETVLPGRVLTELAANDRLVGGVDAASTTAGVELYESFVDGELHRTDATTAEFVKLAQNTYRDVNVALANEFAKLARAHGVDPRAVVAMGNTHPRVDIHRPGMGTGGHCLPNDPWFLFEGVDRETIIEHARHLNDGMVAYVCDLLADRLTLDASLVTVLGAAYKGNVADARNSPGLRLAEELRDRRGAAVRIHDPHIDESVHPDLETGEIPAASADADALVVATDHDKYRALPPESVRDVMRTPLVVDTRDVLDYEEWRDAGFDVTWI